jgi:hypothetical protein
MSALFSFVLFIFCGFNSISMIDMGIKEFSPTLQIIMAIPFFSILILSLSISYYSFLDFSKKVKFWKL